MNKNLSRAIDGVEKADAILFAIEKAYLDFEFVPEGMERANRGVNAFYALWDIVKDVASELDELAGDEEVVNVIKAIRGENRKIVL